MSSGDRLFSCRATVYGKRCGFTGTDPEAEAHELDAGHARCACCRGFLSNFEVRACENCVTRTRDAITTIRDADLEPVVEATALHPGELPGGRALVMLADGNENGLRPYPTKRLPTDRELDVPHGGLVGDEFCWLPYLERRRPAEGREHFADHRGFNDPLIPRSLVEGVARSWRKALGETVPPLVPTSMRRHCDYLLTRLHRAAEHAPDFDDEARELWQLAAQVANTAGLVNYPEVAPARCFDCGGRLVSEYREPVAPLPEVAARLGLPREGREMADTDDDTPLPIWQCEDRACERVYQPAEYWLALRAFLEQQAEAAG